LSGNHKTRVFALGLDGATFDLIQPWAQAGKLPTLARLMSVGSWGVLRSVIPPVTMPAWASFLTGLSPGNHGLYSFLQRQPGTYSMTPFNASYLQASDIGSLLNRHGKRVALINVPATYPPKPLDGMVVTGLETPGQTVAYTHPAWLQEELHQRFDYEVERTEKYDPGQEKLFWRAVERVEQKRLEAVLWLMEQDAWDFFAVVFRGTDILGHAFWRFMDPTHPAHDPVLAQEYGDVLLRHYQKMDTAVAQIQARLLPDDILLLMSDHGFGPIHRDVYIDNVLAQAGLLHMKQTTKARARQMLFQAGLTPRNMLRLLAWLRLRNLSRKLIPQNKRLAVSAGLLLYNSVDWSRTVAYPLGGAGQIFVNLQGREPEGIVESGMAYTAVCDEVERALLALRDPDTGKPVVARVWRKAEAYGTHALPDLPDLYIEWVNDQYTDMGGIGYGRGIFSEPIRGRSGGHTMRGIFLAHGPGIKQGYHVSDASLIDLAPTIMHLLGAPVPAQMDGKVLLDILAESPTTVVYDDASMAPEAAVYAFSDTEQATIEKRLHDLGYI
jgi:predicted AlkP superfamily phosphohydrolase/phosphomutase